MSPKMYNKTNLKSLFQDQGPKKTQREGSPCKIAENLNDKIDKLVYFISDKQYSIAMEYKSHLLANHGKALAPYGQLLTQLDEDMAEIQDLVKWFDLNEGWSLQDSNGRMRIRYQQLPGSPRVVARIDTEVGIPLDVFVSLIYETELYPVWFPFCKSSTIVKQPDKATKIVHIHSSPPVISDREICAKGWGVNNFNYDGTVYVLSHSIDKKPHILERYGEYSVKFPENPKYVRSDLTVFCTKIRPKAYDHHEVSLVICIDLKLKYIPDFLPNYMLRKFCGTMFEKLIANAKNYKGSKWEERKLAGSEFYRWLDEKYKEIEPRLNKAQDNFKK